MSESAAAGEPNPNNDNNIGGTAADAADASSSPSNYVVSSITDVTKENFLVQSNDLILRIPKAAWIAVDEEMTGICLPGTPRPSKADTPADRFPTLKKVSERYSIIQLGLCLFEEAGIIETPDGGERMSFHARRYKFTLFPPADNHTAREVTFNPSSIQFLAQNNMSFDHMVASGIPYVTKENAEQLMDKFYQKQTEAEDEKKPSTPRRKVKLVHLEDRNFHARSMASLREWLDAAIPQQDVDPNDQNAPPEGTSFLLPPCNSFLRRAMYESIEMEYPNLVVETSQGSQIRVLRLNPEERKLRKARMKREGWEKILSEKLGVYRVFLALTNACSGSGPSSQAEHMMLAPSIEEAMDTFVQENSVVNGRKVPLVVHNGLQDLLFLLTHFHKAGLPEAWPDCKQLIHSYFPVIYDTKCMASEFVARERRGGPTHLAAVYEQTLSSHPHWNRTFGSVDGDEQQQEHDAGWDAYMTGAAFCGLSYAIHDFLQFPPCESCRSQFELWNCDPSDEAFANMYGRNKIHFHLSPYTIDLESTGKDPMGTGMSRQSTYCVAGIEASVTTRDIARCLTGLVDADGVRVSYEIIWIDDRSFLAGAKLPNCQDTDLFSKHGTVVKNALLDTFRHGETIEVLEESEHELKGEQETGVGASIWNLWGMFGTQRKRSSEDEDAAPSAKRRRTS